MGERTETVNTIYLNSFPNYRIKFQQKLECKCRVVLQLNDMLIMYVLKFCRKAEKIMDYKKMLKSGLEALGLEKGDAVIVHSSLKSLGNFPNREQTVIDALLEQLNDEGTLLMPCLSYETVTPDNPVFNVKKTPSCVGWLTEYFRNMPESRRSVHPTHSVCGIGKKADFLLGTHQIDTTPCGENSPFSKLVQIGGKILFLGCGLKPNTFMHGIEELSRPPYLFGEEIDYIIEPENQPAFHVKHIRHNFEGYEQRYDRVINVLDKNDYSFGKVLEADAYLLQTKPLWQKAHEILKKAPYYFVDRKMSVEQH